MNLTEATRMILAESAAHPELMRAARHAYDECAAGRTPTYQVLGGILREAARKGLYPVLRERYGDRAFEEMVMVMGREVDRQAPVPARRVT
ncbi:hypothetical protein [Thermomonospora amylolytica]|uniref:hypothetical protein n=1 Tax=Thermomonospora amylolytica TaxID=1411117 RepID=UPI000E6D0875|nr:hypothetical protein [Thermomonospora amylolytica]